MTLSISYSDLKAQYASSNISSDAYVSRSDLYKEIGWDEFIDNPNYYNTCAIRVSLALVKVGVAISPGSHRILKGDHKGKRVQVSMRRLADVLATDGYLGAPEILDAGTISEGRAARQGIIAFNGIAGYTGGGHIDLIDNHGTADVCASSCYFGSDSTWFWPLPGSMRSG